MANSPNTIAIADSDAPDKYLWTYQYTVGGTASQEQVYVPGPAPWPTYDFVASQITLATANSHLLFIMADGTNYDRIKSIRIMPRALPTASAAALIRLFRVTSIGTGGTAVNGGAFDSSDGYGGTAQALPSSLGTETGVALAQWSWHIPGTAYTFNPYDIYWEAPEGGKEIIFGNGTATGIAIKNVSAISGAFVDIMVTLTTTAHL